MARPRNDAPLDAGASARHHPELRHQAKSVDAPFGTGNCSGHPHHQRTGVDVLIAGASSLGLASGLLRTAMACVFLDGSDRIPKSRRPTVLRALSADRSRKFATDTQLRDRCRCVRNGAPSRILGNEDAKGPRPSVRRSGDLRRPFDAPERRGDPSPCDPSHPVRKARGAVCARRPTRIRGLIRNRQIGARSACTSCAGLGSTTRCRRSPWHVRCIRLSHSVSRGDSACIAGGGAGGTAHRGLKDARLQRRRRRRMERLSGCAA